MENSFSRSSAKLKQKVASNPKYEQQFKIFNDLPNYCSYAQNYKWNFGPLFLNSVSSYYYYIGAQTRILDFLFLILINSGQVYESRSYSKTQKSVKRLRSFTRLTNTQK